MNLKELIQQTHSKLQKDRIVKFIGADQGLFEELVSFVLSDELVLAQRAAWPFSYIAIDHPDWIVPYESVLLQTLGRAHIHDSIKRNILRVWRERLPLNEELWGELFDSCSSLLRNPHEAGAIRAFAMQVMGNIVVRYPELKQELMLTVEDAVLHNTPAIASSARRVHKQLSKLSP